MIQQLQQEKYKTVILSYRKNTRMNSFYYTGSLNDYNVVMNSLQQSFWTNDNNMNWTRDLIEIFSNSL